MAAFRGMHMSPAKHSYVWLPRKCDYRTDRHMHRRTDRCRTKWSLCAAMLCRRHKNMHLHHIHQRGLTCMFAFWIFPLEASAMWSAVLTSDCTDSFGHPSKILTLYPIQPFSSISCTPCNFTYINCELFPYVQNLHIATFVLYTVSIYIYIYTITVSKPAPGWNGTAVINGEFKDIKLDDYKGKYIVFFFYPLAL